jgi:cation:H+ antiporter
VDYLLLLGGFVTLLVGGEALVRGAVGLALKFKISTLVIGMTVVSFGTSAPELLVSLEAALSNHPDVAVGAVIGSNISNLALVLGVTVLIFPIVVNKDTIRIDWPVMMVATVLLFLVAQDLILSQVEGIVFVSILFLFSAWLIMNSRKQRKKLFATGELEDLSGSRSTYKNLLYLLAGFACLYQGAEWLIEGVINLADKYGISEKFISVTVVALGTSLPELIASAMAAIKKETDISIGNLIGSNVFNILAILGITAITKPVPVAASIMDFDIYFMIGISLLVFPLMYFGKSISRIKGAVLVASYIIYIYFVIAAEF